MRPTWGHRAGNPSHIWPCSGWGLPSRPGHPGRWCALTAPFHPCLFTANRAIGGLLSVALSFGSPRLAVSQHPALWSPDLPQPGGDEKRTAAKPRSPGRLAAAILARAKAWSRSKLAEGGWAASRGRQRLPPTVRARAHARIGAQAPVTGPPVTGRPVAGRPVTGREGDRSPRSSPAPELVSRTRSS